MRSNAGPFNVARAEPVSNFTRIERGTWVRFIPSGWLFFFAFPGTPDRGTWVRFPVAGPDGYFFRVPGNADGYFSRSRDRTANRRNRTLHSRSKYPVCTKRPACACFATRCSAGPGSALSESTPDADGTPRGTGAAARDGRGVSRGSGSTASSRPCRRRRLRDGARRSRAALHHTVHRRKRPDDTRPPGTPRRSGWWVRR